MEREVLAPLPDESPFRPRAAIAGKDARTLARDILAHDDEDFRTAFKGSPMKRAKLRGLKRNAAVVLANIGESVEANQHRSITIPNRTSS